MRIAFITAGATGMFCGSCMRDNTLVAGLRKLGHDALLIPTYTPVTLDEPSQSEERVFLGGVNVYLQEKSWIFRHTPRWVDWLFNRNWLLRWASRFASRTKYENLGDLTISMLKGHDGNQRKEIDSLIAFLKDEVKPEVVILTNVLLSGLVPTLKRELRIPIIATLQGDDIFLDALKPSDREKCISIIRQNADDLTGLIATSHFYADQMSRYLSIDRNRIVVIPAGIELKGHALDINSSLDVPTIGFFARIAPEKGFHQLIDAFITLRKQNAGKTVKLRASGWFGEQHRKYYDEQIQKLKSANLENDFEYISSPDHTSKVQFMQSVHVLSVPTTYKEPKGLYVMEAWANGVPVVLPDHGCFTEMVNMSGGGVLVPPGDSDALSRELDDILNNETKRMNHGKAGLQAVKETYSSDVMALATSNYLKSINN